MDIYNRKSNVKTYKGEITSQVKLFHQLKAGLEYRTTHITYNNLSVLQSSWTGYSPVILNPEDNTIHNSFQSMIDPYQGQFYNDTTFIDTVFWGPCPDDYFVPGDAIEVVTEKWDGKYLDGRRPVEFSFYLQDKISDDIIVNIGMRYDYFDSQFCFK